MQSLIRNADLSFPLYSRRCRSSVTTLRLVRIAVLIKAVPPLLTGIVSVCIVTIFFVDPTRIRSSKVEVVQNTGPRLESVILNSFVKVVPSKMRVACVVMLAILMGVRILQ